MILKDDIPKTCSYTRMILYSLQHFKALQLHIRTITAITTGSRGDMFVVRTSKPVENI